MAMKRINLLPPEERAKARRERGLMWVIVALVALIVVLGGIYLWQNNQVGDKEDEAAQLEADIAAVQTQAAALQQYAVLQTKRTEMTSTAKSIDAARVPWSTIFEEISLVIPENVRLQSLTCAVPANMLPGRRRGPRGRRHRARRRHHLHRPDVRAQGRRRVHDPARPAAAAHQHPAVELEQGGRRRTTGTTQSLTTFTVTASLRRYLMPPPTTTAGGAQ